MTTDPGMTPGMTPAHAGAPAGSAPPDRPGPDPAARMLIALFAIGAAVSLTLGVYGRVHTPTGIAVNLAGFSGPLEVKVWLATCAVLAAVVQLVSALAMYGKVPAIGTPRWVSRVHRWSGRTAFLLAVPVAVHCLYALGLQTYDARVLVHSVMGCAFFGAFTVKMLVLSTKRMPGWALPVLGAAVFSALALLWMTSSLWFFTTAGVRF